MNLCAACGTENAPRAHFCANCGAALAGLDAPRAQRKTVTVVFCDLVGSTSLGESLDPEQLRAFLARYFSRMRAILERHGGTVEKYIGDAVMAVFGVPVAHEDDVVRALRAADEMRHALDELGVDARIGVNSGEVFAVGGDWMVTGDAVNVAARLQQTARPRGVVLGAATRALAGPAAVVTPLVPLDLKGKADPVEAFELVAVAEIERPHEARFVGRRDELELLVSAWERVKTERRCELLTVVGEAGVGKSRLVAELVGAVDARVVRGRCLSYGEGITYWPVVEVVKQLGVLPADPEAAAPLRAVLGETDATTSTEEIAWAFRKLLEQESPLLVVFDDLQWGEPAFLSLVEQIPRLASGRALLVVCLARPELKETRPPWPVALRLRPLPEASVRELLPATVSDDLRDAIVRRAGGNPLFVTEMVAMAARAGGDVAVPQTLKALLAARLDQLATHERSVLEGGSIEGELFHRGGVEALTPEHAQIAQSLASLVRAELVRPTAPVIRSEEAFRFCHLLMRDAAYDALPKEARAELHERFADWLALRARELVERDELVGFHLEQAHRYHAELGASGGPIDALAQRASRHLALSARRASSRSDFDAAANLLQRALALGVEDPRELLELQLELGRAFGATRRVAEADTLLAEVATAADERGEASIASVARVLRLWNRTGNLELELDEMLAVAAEAIRTFESAHDDAGLVPARRLRGLALNGKGDAEGAAGEFEQAIVHAEASGDRELLRSAVNSYFNGHVVAGPMPAPQAIARCEDVMRRAGHDRVVVATVKRPLSVLLGMAGRRDEALVMLEQAAHVLDELNLRNMQVYRHNVAYALELAGDLEGAERELKATCSYFDGLRGAPDSRSFGAAVELARIYCNQGRWDEADAILRDYPDFPYPLNRVRRAARKASEARLLAQRGRAADAVERVSAAVAATNPFPGALLARAQIWTAAAEVHRATGDDRNADAALQRALDLYLEKGNVSAAASLRAMSLSA